MKLAHLSGVWLEKKGDRNAGEALFFYPLDRLCLSAPPKYIFLPDQTNSDRSLLPSCDIHSPLKSRTTRSNKDQRLKMKAAQLLPKSHDIAICARCKNTIFKIEPPNECKLVGHLPTRREECDFLAAPYFLRMIAERAALEKGGPGPRWSDRPAR